ERRKTRFKRNQTLVFTAGPISNLVRTMAFRREEKHFETQCIRSVQLLAQIRITSEIYDTGSGLGSRCAGCRSGRQKTICMAGCTHRLYIGFEAMGAGPTCRLGNLLETTTPKGR